LLGDKTKEKAGEAAKIGLGTGLARTQSTMGTALGSTTAPKFTSFMNKNKQ
jgi:hypothetical protein